MSEKNIDKELSIDELKDVSGGGMGLDRLGTQKTTGKKKNKSKSETMIGARGSDEIYEDISNERSFEQDASCGTMIHKLG